jgi:hypothetical protein
MTVSPPQSTLTDARDRFMQKHIQLWLLLTSLWPAAGAWAQSYYVDITNQT